MFLNPVFHFYCQGSLRNEAYLSFTGKLKKIHEEITKLHSCTLLQNRSCCASFTDPYGHQNKTAETDGVGGTTRNNRHASRVAFGVLSKVMLEIEPLDDVRHALTLTKNTCWKHGDNLSGEG